MNFFKKTFYTSFVALNFTQFFSALNDNIYKLLLVFMLINIEGPEHSNTILSLAGAVFVIPFLLLAALAGSLADRFSKRSIIYITRFLELIIVSGGVAAMFFKSAVGGYTVLFLMATQSTLFSPAKYGIIPEIVEKTRISRYNGIMTATTYLAIILGTFLASFLADVTHKNFVLSSLVCLFIAVFGMLSSLGIEKTKPQAKEKKVSTRFLSDILRSLQKAKKIRYLFPTILFGAYFLFMGAYTQLNIIPFALQSLHLSEIQGGYLFLMTAIGIGLGSFFAGRFSKDNVELGFVPIATFGISLTLSALYFFQYHFLIVVPLLIVLGIFGGFFVVPIDAFIQSASPNEDRGQNVAAYNFLSFVGVVVASFLIAFLGNTLDLKASQGFLVVGILTFFVSLTLIVLMADQVLRLLVAKAAALFWDLRIVGRKNILLTSPVLLVGDRSSWLDTIVVMATLPRLLRYIVPIDGKFQRQRSFLYRFLRLIPLHANHFSPITPNTLDEIKKEIAQGQSVCLMLPVRAKSENLASWGKELCSLLKEVSCPIVPIYIERKAPEKQGVFAGLLSLFKTPLKVSYGSSRILD